jgi:hypothetical protein
MTMHNFTNRDPQLHHVAAVAALNQILTKSDPSMAARHASTDQRDRTRSSMLNPFTFGPSERAKGIIMSRQLTQEIKTTRRPEPTVDDEAVKAMAYQLWLERGCPIGSEEEDWYQAEAALRNTGQSRQRVA